MKARILTLTAVGSLVFAVSPAYAGSGPAHAVRRLEFVIVGDGGSAAVSTPRAPTAIAHHKAKEPWKAPYRSQVAKNSF
jgi:hypothetical protein